MPTELNVIYIPKTALVTGRRYYCLARNFEVGTWNGEAFEYMRTKFKDTYLDTELHWDDDEKHGTVKPLAIINE